MKATAPPHLVSGAREDALWLLHRLAPQRGVGNVAAAASVTAAVDFGRLTGAIAAVLARRPSLRRTFTTGHENDGDGSGLTAARLQQLPADAKPECVDELVCEAQLPRSLATLCTRPFADGAVLVRAALLRTSGRSVLCLAMNQLVAGPEGAEAVLREVIDAYDGISSGPDRETTAHGAPRVPPWPAPRAQSRRYWAEALRGVEPGRLPMATARPLPALPTFAGAVLRRSLAGPWRSALATLAARHEASEAAVLLALYAMLLAQHGSGPDLVIGVTTRTADPAAPRTTQPGPGLLPLRLRLQGQTRFGALLHVVRDTLSAAAEHADIEGEGLPTPPRPTSRWWNPWYHHALTVRTRQSPLSDARLAGQMVHPLPAAAEASDLDLHLTLRVTDGGIDLDARFSTEAHTADEIDAFLDRYAHLLRHVQDTTPVDQPLLCPADRALIAAANATDRDLPDTSVADLLLAQTRHTPDALAVDTARYRDLAALAADIRECLIRAGAGVGAVVAVTGPRGAHLAASMLGVWMSGAAYLPLGVDAPPERTRQQLTDTQVALVLRVGTAPVPHGPWSVIDVPGDDAHSPSAVSHSQQAPTTVDTPHAAAASARAYALFTSGSTGRPKAVTVSHSALTNLVADMVARLPVHRADRMLWSTAISFDISALELWAPLCAGAHVRTVPDNLLLAPGDLLRFVEQEQISILQGTPTLWQHLAPHLADRMHGRLILVGGEPLPATLAERLIASGAQVLNMYGPTETTIWSTTARLASPVPQPVPIGRPIANTRVYVLDHRGNPVFPGTPGELCIAGHGLADGYLGDSELTRTRFRTDPGRARYYRTGDRVRQRPDGALEFLGREDRQVKIRGHRVEMAEVEAALASHPKVSAAAVVADSDPSGRLRLAAAVSSADDTRDLVPNLQRHAAGLLPRPAVPARIAVVPALPTTPNGKIDYVAVNRLLSAQTHGPPAPTRDPLLETLTSLWSTALAAPGLDHGADFFHHGGSPRQALALTADIRRHTGRPIPFDAVFRAPTPEAMHRLLTAEKRR